MRYIIKILLAVIFVFVLLAAIPFWHHKEVAGAYQAEFDVNAYYGDTTGTERVAYIADNNEAMIYRLQMIAEAQEQIKYSTFEIRSDESGKDVLCALLLAADRGVRVSLLTDGFNTMLELNGNKWFQAFATHENVSIMTYNQRSLLKPWHMQAALHDKYMIIDDRMYLLGGRNTFDLFLGNYSQKKNIDRELFVYNTRPEKESSLQQLEDYFDKISGLPDNKRYECKRETAKVRDAYTKLLDRADHLKETYPEAGEIPDWESKTVETNRITLLSNPIEPDNKEPRLWFALCQLMKNEDDITIHTPYIICGEEMYRDLKEVCQEAGTVNIIINDPTGGANPWGCTDYLNEQKNIRDTGVNLYEYLGEDSLHSKTFRMGERISIVGSFNMDMRSTYIDTELMLVVDSEALNDILQKEEQQQYTYCKQTQDGETYVYGENYVERKNPVSKQLAYMVLRQVIKPIRRFL